MIQKSKPKRARSTSEQKDLLKFKELGLKVKLVPQRKWKKGQENKWLADLLKIIGRSQQQLAAMVGVSPNTIANVKTGRGPLTPKLAQKIYVATGAYHVPYFQGKDSVVSPANTPYTKATFEHWRKNYTDTDDESINEFFGYASDTLFVLLAAAGRCKLRNHLPALRQSFWDWCVESYKNFQLQKPVDEFLEERKYIKELTMSYRDWRDPHPSNADLRKLYGFKDDKIKSDDENLTLKYEAHPGFCPCGNMKQPEGGIESEHFVFARPTKKS